MFLWRCRFSLFFNSYITFPILGFLSSYCFANLSQLASASFWTIYTLALGILVGKFPVVGACFCYSVPDSQLQHLWSPPLTQPKVRISPFHTRLAAIREQPPWMVLRNGSATMQKRHLFTGCEATLFMVFFYLTSLLSIPTLMLRLCSLACLM